MTAAELFTAQGKASQLNLIFFKWSNENSRYLLLLQVTLRNYGISGDHSSSGLDNEGLHIFVSDTHVIYAKLDEAIFYVEEKESDSGLDTGPSDQDDLVGNEHGNNAGANTQNRANGDETPVENERDGRNESNKSCYGSKRIAII
ncbi:hypothetical protein COEREDRAFT_88138 [Coemansia reversa NRRL 1564]|uniref:Uncharacterized protein n=1 Tax=Coemansia reversa (strain ATCC 12441 / NRRL 1564) TaxID=763665 RepID=A0A2G5B7S3_COERN|nr:hypothetical protein COEREDRAFT_88138 [Coemansia reversa NRRL 1564]|eukprot:PIA15032.1 hypothetical protein COEREDRAFT_88138 [Coemansia reversa NRRL 1564]